jgi:hypothetical protein
MSIASLTSVSPTEHLQGTEWYDETVIERAAEHFDKNAKRKFESVTQMSLVDLGGFKSDAKLKIVRGKLKITGWIISLCYRHPAYG